MTDSNRRLYEFFVDGKKYESEKSHLSGLEIKTKASIEGNYQLYLEEERDTPDRAISDGETVSLEHRIMHFFAVPPATFGRQIVGATRSDLGHTKVSVAARYLRTFLEEVSIDAIVGDVVYDSVARRLINADLIVCCTDSHGSRSVVQQVAYQHLILCIDLGVNRRPNLTPDRRPILTPLSDESGR
jgi:hypothetical protein